ncbi:MAG: hypothetical protein PS018_20855 [bacterium]|nr:hypothetical protein [bacterium]
MIEALALLRRTAEACELEAREPDNAAMVRAEMMDLAAKWHWLAGEAATLCRKRKELTGDEDAACASCLERCLGQVVLELSKSSGVLRQRASPAAEF